MRAYSVKVEVTGGNGHVRYVSGPMARAMVSAGHAEIANANGRVKGIMLLTTAASLVRIGEPTGRWGDVRFSVREKLDCGTVVWKHHPRCTYE